MCSLSFFLFFSYSLPLRVEWFTISTGVNSFVYIYFLNNFLFCFENWCCSPVFVLIWFCYIKSRNGLILLFKCLLTLPPVRSFPDIICNSFLKFHLFPPSNMLTYLDLNPQSILPLLILSSNLDLYTSYLLKHRFSPFSFLFICFFLSIISISI